MNSFTVFLAFVLAAVVVAEPPGYNYNRPSGLDFSSSGSGGGLFSASGHGGGGGGYEAVSHGYQTSEGQHVDGQLLEQIRQILLREESQSHGGGHGGIISQPSSAYGVPSSSYGVPSHHRRVVGIDLDGVRQAVQVAQYRQISHSAGGYPARRPSSTYGAPF